MKVLILGGTRYVGRLLAWRLVASGHRVTLFHRGTRAVPFADRVETLLGDRDTGVLPSLVKGRSFDATVDFGAYAPADVEPLLDTVARDALGHYVMISTGQVYLVREGCPRPAREVDYDGVVMPRPASDPDASQWDYGAGKRACEDLIAHERVQATRVRVPMINGVNDSAHRIESYLWRLLDGAEVLLPDGGDAPMRHVYAEDVARAVASMLGDARCFGQAYNLAQDETPTLREMVERLAWSVGAQAKLVAVPSAEMEARGLSVRDASPFSARWMSDLDATRAKSELGFVPTELWTYVDRVVAAFLAHASSERPEGYAQRAQEVALAREVGRDG